MKLSVIIVSYNVKHYLLQCLDSLQKALEGVEAEIYVVDNHSKDGTPDYISSRCKGIKLIASNHNNGFAKANNTAIKRASGKYVLLLNPDTFVGENTIKECLHFMDTHPQAGGLGVQMLKNNGALPLKVDDEGYNVNMFGVGGTESEVNGFYIFGGGSGSVIIDKEDVVFLKEGLESAGFKVNQTLYNFFLENKANPSVSWWQSNQNILSQAKMYSDTAVVTISRFNGEKNASLPNGKRTENTRRAKRAYTTACAKAVATAAPATPHAGKGPTP